MKKSDSNTPRETPEQELKRLRKENAKLKAQILAEKAANKAEITSLKKELKATSRLQAKKDAQKAEIRKLKKELKKKDVPKEVFSEELRKQLSSLFPGIDSVFNS